MRSVDVFLAASVVILASSAGARPGLAQADRNIEIVFESDVVAWPEESKRWALVVGVSKYADPQISPVAGADNDP